MPPPKPKPRWKIPDEDREPVRPVESEHGGTPTTGGGRQFAAIVAVGLSIFVNSRSSTAVPMERMNVGSLVGFVIGLGLLGAFAYWLAGKLQPVAVIGGFMLLAVVVMGLDSGNTSAITPTTVATPTVREDETPRVIPLRKLSPQEWQACLIASGYDLGPSGADGIWGQKSQEAYTSFWAAHPSGTVNEAEIRRCWGGTTAVTAPAIPKSTAPLKPRKTLDEAIKEEVVHESGQVDDTPTTVAAPAAEPAPPYISPAAPPYIAPVPDYGSRTEHVSGYTRKDGTYVAPYTRRPSH
jgi:hypothetical protein